MRAMPANSSRHGAGVPISGMRAVAQTLANASAPQDLALPWAAALDIGVEKALVPLKRQAEIYGWLTVAAGTGEGGRRYEDRLITARRPAVLVGLKAPGVRQLRHAERVDLVRRDQGGRTPSGGRACRG